MREGSDQSVVDWVRRSPSARLVRWMAAGEMDISLEAIAAVPQTAGTGYLAAVFIESGVVPRQDFDLVKLNIWVEQQCRRLPSATDRLMVKQFYRWVYLPKLRARFEGPGDSRLRTHRAKGRLKNVFALLEQIHNLGSALSDFLQRDFDSYAVETPAAVGGLPEFLRWARGQGITDLRIGHQQSSLPASSVSETERLRWVSRLVSDSDIPLSTRVAGILVIGFGVPTTRALALRRDAIGVGVNGAMTIQIGSTPIVLPAPVEDLVRQHLDLGGKDTLDWLFPGRRPGRPLTGPALWKALKQLGIRTSAARFRAQLTLAGDIPALLFAEVLGTSIRGASRVATAAGRNWADYPALRFDETN
jgi:hypothetical protein